MIPSTTDLGGCKLDPSNGQDDVPTSSEAKYNGRVIVALSDDGSYLLATSCRDMTNKIHILFDGQWRPTTIEVPSKYQ